MEWALEELRLEDFGEIVVKDGMVFNFECMTRDCQTSPMSPSCISLQSSSHSIRILLDGS